ncbi:MAG: hypothetical protein GY810_27485 [Aureispira sp.]|nr:hypothetical protein [Aureispira sp.]
MAESNKIKQLLNSENPVYQKQGLQFAYSLKLEPYYSAYLALEELKEVVEIHQLDESSTFNDISVSECNTVNQAILAITNADGIKCECIPTDPNTQPCCYLISTPGYSQLACHPSENFIYIKFQCTPRQLEQILPLCQKLKSLIIEGESLDQLELPNILWELKTLKSLVFYNCGIANISPQINNLTNLLTLKIFQGPLELKYKAGFPPCLNIDNSIIGNPKLYVYIYTPNTKHNLPKKDLQKRIFIFKTTKYTVYNELIPIVSADFNHNGVPPSRSGYPIVLNSKLTWIRLWAETQFDGPRYTTNVLVLGLEKVIWGICWILSILSLSLRWMWFLWWHFFPLYKYKDIDELPTPFDKNLE